MKHVNMQGSDLEPSCETRLQAKFYFISAQAGGIRVVASTIVPETSACFVPVRSCAGGTQSIVLLHRDFGGGGAGGHAKPGPSEQLHAELHEPPWLVSYVRRGGLCQQSPPRYVAPGQLVDFEGLGPWARALIPPPRQSRRDRASPGRPQKIELAGRGRRTTNAYPLYVSLSTSATQPVSMPHTLMDEAVGSEGRDKSSTKPPQIRILSKDQPVLIIFPPTFQLLEDQIL